jgi:hypothetical protein
MKGNWKKVCILARCLARSSIMISSMLLPNFKKSSKIMNLPDLMTLGLLLLPGLLLSVIVMVTFAAGG